MIGQVRRGRWAQPGPSSQRGQRLATSCFSTLWKAPAFPGHGAPPPSLLLRAWVPHHFSFPHPLPPCPAGWVPTYPTPPLSPSSPSFPISSPTPLFSLLLKSQSGPPRVRKRKLRQRQQGPTSHVCAPHPPASVSGHFPSFLPPLSLSVCLRCCPHLCLRLSLALPPGAYSVQPSRLPVPGPPATCPEVSSGAAGWRVPGPYGSLLPGLSPERDPQAQAGLPLSQSHFREQQTCLTGLRSAPDRPSRLCTEPGTQGRQGLNVTPD